MLRIVLWLMRQKCMALSDLPDTWENTSVKDSKIDRYLSIWASRDGGRVLVIGHANGRYSYEVLTLVYGKRSGLFPHTSKGKLWSGMLSVLRMLIIASLLVMTLERGFDLGIEE